MKHRLARAAARSALAVLSLLGSARDAAAWTPVDPSSPRWAQMPVGYFVNGSTVPGSIAGIAVARIDAGFTSWSSPACTGWRTQNLGDTTDTYVYDDGQNVFHWISGSWPSELGTADSVIGVTMPVWVRDDSIFDADMVFNNVGFCWNNSGFDGCVDTQSIATHEEGHFLGLGHSEVASATMVAFYDEGSSLRSLGDDDIEGICELYPAGGVSTCRGCFDGSSSGSGACATSRDQCVGSASCSALIDCFSACDGDACNEACIDANLEGAELYIGMIECLCSDCATECVNECGGAGGAGPTSMSSTTGTGPVTTGAGGAGGAPDADKPRSDADGFAEGSGCNCTVGSPSTGLGGLLLFVAALALASRRRRG